MKRLIAIGIIAIVLFAGCNSIPNTQVLPDPINVVTNAIPDEDSNAIVVAIDDIKPPVSGLTWSNIGERLNNKKCYFGLSLLVLAAALTVTLIVLKKKRSYDEW